MTESPDSPPIARTHGLYRFYSQGADKVAVLRNVSFDVGRSEFVCIMGPSGSGKSTLLHLISGLDEPSAGTVELAGRQLETLSEKERTLLRRDTIGYVFQFFNLMPNLNVIENVGLPLSIQGVSPSAHHERLAGLLEGLGLGERMRSLPHMLSGGEMQRASIARALAGGQPLLLCDEPTGNLSQKAGLGVMKTLRRLRDEQQRSILLVTHNPRDACFADRVLFLVDGELAPGVELHGPDIPVDDVHAALASLSI